MTITGNIKKVGILLRISREAGEGRDTLLTHRDIGKRYCKKHGYEYQIYEEIISGTVDNSERVELTKLLNDVTMGILDAVFVVDVNRLSRNLGASQKIADTLADYELPLLTPERSYDLNSNDRFMFDLEGVMASQELREITKRYKRGKREGSLRGEWVQGVTPYGYIRNPKTKKLIIEEPEAQVVRMIFDYALAGYGIATIVNKLTGYRTRSYEVKSGKNAGTIHTGKTFGISHVNTILKNPVYKGTLSYEVKNKQKQVVETIIVNAAHEGIVTPLEFQQVQEAVKGRISGGDNGLAKRTRSRGKVITILKDLVYCPCGLKMQFKRDSKQKEKVFVKACTCGNKGIAEHKLIEVFWDELSIIESQFRHEWDSLLKNADHSSKNVDNLHNQLTLLSSEKEKLTKKAKRIRNIYSDGDISRDEYLEDKSEVENEITRISTLMNEVQERVELSNKENISLQYEAKLKWLSDIRDLADKYEGRLFVMGSELTKPPFIKVDSEDIEEINRLLKLIIDKVYYNRYNEETVLYEDGFVDTEKGDFIEVTIKPK